MNKTVKVLLFIANLLFIAVAGYFLAERFLNNSPGEDITASHPHFHELLKLTDKQKEMLVPIEKEYAEKKAYFEQQIRVSNMELADAMRQEKDFTPKVREAVEKNHRLMGELQNITLKHIFDMRSLLNEEQSQILDDYVAEVLYGKHEE